MDFKNAPKIVSKSSQNRPWGGPWGCPGTSPRPPGSRRAGLWDAAKIYKKIEASRTRPGVHSGAQPGPQNLQKINLLRKRVLQGTRFYRFLWQMSFSLAFWLIFGRFFMKNRWKNRRVFFTCAHVFFKLATPTKHYILRYESYFFAFWVFVFLWKK